MFVDDSLFANVACIIKHGMTASIEALYLVLGFPDELVRQNSLSLDNYFSSIASYERVQLGKLVNTRTMSVHEQYPLTSLTSGDKKWLLN